MRTLCPNCGTITNHRWSLLPPLCPSCKKRLPLRLPRKLSYLTRSFWKPTLIVFTLAVLIGFSPYTSTYRQSFKKAFSQNPAGFNIPPARYTQ